jgi:hypothetical protein
MCVLLVTSRCDFVSTPRNLNGFQKPVELNRLSVRAQDGTVIWEIRRNSGVERVDEVRYGQVPSGFAQVTPNGRPRPIKDGESLAILEVTRSTYACNRGRGVAPDGFRQEIYETLPTTGTNAAWRDAAKKIEDCMP